MAPHVDWPHPEKLSTPDDSDRFRLGHAFERIPYVGTPWERTGEAVALFVLQRLIDSKFSTDHFVMFRIATAHLKPSVRIPRRTFVSTVLLTRTWENESTSSLRKEAKSRGLSVYVLRLASLHPSSNTRSRKGSKATLITRLQEHEARERPQPPPPPRASVQQIRHSSTVETEVPGLPSSSEPPTLPPSFPKEFLDVKIPDTSVPIPEAPTPIVCPIPL